MAKTPKRSIEVTLTFSEQELNEILSQAHFGRGKAPKVKNLTDDQFALFTRELQKTNFKTEIIDGTQDAAANDWLADLMDQFQ